MIKNSHIIIAWFCIAVFVIVFFARHSPDSDIKHPITGPYENEK